ncbi:MAG: hypothetical protein JWL66_1558 [Sphingomonadales bacterium]|nr:hypothetical protein [Sphingomonadales bacterium]
MKIDWGKRDPDEGRAQLARWLGKQPGVTQASVSTWRVPRAGSSYETVFCHATWDQEGQHRDEELVVRIQPDSYSLFPEADLFLQSDVMRALENHPSVPVPRIYWVEPGTEALGGPFFVMSLVPGEVPPDLIMLRKGNFVEALTSEQRTAVYSSGLAAMAAIHRIDWRNDFQFLDHQRGGDAGLDRYLRWVENWYRWAAAGRRIDVIEEGLLFLRKQQPKGAGVGIIWGDARAGNIIFGNDLQPAAVIDWEMAALGPGEVDLGWWVMWETIWIPDGVHPENQGFLTRGQMISTYEQHLGRVVEDFHYYEVLAGIRFAIMMTVGVDRRIEEGILPRETTAGTHNVATRYVSRLLGLPEVELSPDLHMLAGEMGEA